MNKKTFSDKHRPYLKLQLARPLLKERLIEIFSQWPDGTEFDFDKVIREDMIFNDACILKGEKVPVIYFNVRTNK